MFFQDIVQTPLPSPDHDYTAADESGSSTSLETDYEVDPDIPEGVIVQSQPRFRRGIHYTPLGLKRVYRERRKVADDYGTDSTEAAATEEVKK